MYLNPDIWFSLIYKCDVDRHLISTPQDKSDVLGIIYL